MHSCTFIMSFQTLDLIAILREQVETFKKKNQSFFLKLITANRNAMRPDVPQPLNTIKLSSGSCRNKPGSNQINRSEEKDELIKIGL